MIVCPHCGGPDADLFTTQGTPICGSCDQRFRADAQQARGYAADPIGASMTFASPGKLMAVGAAMMGAAIALGLLESLVVGRVHLVLLGGLALVGFGSVARGAMG